MLEDKTSKLLKKAGWYEGRKIDISNQIKILEDSGYEVFQAAKRFLEEYGELEVILKHEFRGEIHEYIHSTEYNKLNFYYKDCDNYDEEVGEKTIPVCKLFDGEYLVCISESGKFFIGMGMIAEDTDGFWNGKLGEFKGGFLHWEDYKAGKEFKLSGYKNKNYIVD